MAVKKSNLLSLFLFVMMLLTVLAANTTAIADNVAQVQTTKFFAPETVNMLKQRIAQGTGGNLLQAGDVVSYIITFTPVNNGNQIGVAGYITDYIPPNTQVVGASFVLPDGVGGFSQIDAQAPGIVSDGFGRGGNPGPGVFIAPFATTPYGSLAAVYGDTGIFYSTDTRTSMYAGPMSITNFAPPLPTMLTPTPGIKATQANGYDVTAMVGPTAPKLNSIVHNYWDVAMDAYFSAGGPPPYNAGSAVAGPDAGYQLDYTGFVGPWQRISYPGSLQVINPQIPNQAPVVIPEPGAIIGTPATGGWNLSTSNPLPLNTNAVRFAFGRLQVGQFNYCKISLKLLTDPPVSGIQNNSEVFGGDGSYDPLQPGRGNQDNVWKYADADVADNNSGFFLLKEIVAINGVPSNGINVVAGDVVTYRVSYINTGIASLYIRFYDEMTRGLYYQAGSAQILSGPNVFAPAVIPTFAPVTAPTAVASSAATFPPAINPAILIGPATGGSFQMNGVVTVAGATNKFVSNSITANYGATAAALTNSQTSRANSTYGLMPSINQSKTASPNSISPGSSTVYTLTINNVGSGLGGATLAQAIPSTITDILPPGFSYATGTTSFTNSGTPVALSAPSVVTNANGQQEVAWTIPAGIQIASRTGVWQLSFTANTTVAIAPNTYYNSFSSHIYYLDPQNRPGYMDTATSNVAPVTVSKTRLTKSTTTPSVYMTSNGATAHYTVNFYNDNLSALSNVSILDTLPSGFSYKVGTASSSINGGAVSAIPSGNITTGTSTVAFNMGTLAANSYMVINFDVNIATSANIGTNNNTVSATADIAGTPVTIPAYTGAPVVIQPQGLVVNKFVSDSLGNPLPVASSGVPFTPVAGILATSVYTASKAVYYTVELINSGNAYANNVGVTDVLPTGFVYTPANNPTILYRQSVNNVITTIAAASVASAPVVDLAKTYTVIPKWSTFSIPPQQNGISSKILITFPVDVRQNTGGGLLPVDVLKSAAQYTNTVTADGANNIFSGAPVDVYMPINKVSVTKTVVRGSNATYTINILNNTSSSYVVSIADTVKTLANVTQNWPFVSDTLTAVGAVHPIVGAVGILNWTNVTVPSGGLSFDFTVTVPALQAAAVYHNTATVTIVGGGNNTYTGILPANTGEDVNVVLVAPVVNTPPTLLKNTLNALTVAGPFTIASSPAPVYVNTAGKIWYELVIQNNASTVAGLTIGNTIDTLPGGFTAVAADLLAANYIMVTRPKNSISGTYTVASGATLVAHAAMTIAGQNLTIPTTGKIIPASTVLVPQGFEMAIIFRATIGTALAPVTPGQYSNVFTVNDPVVTNPALGSYSGGLVDVAPIRITKSIDPASSTIMAGQTTSYTIEIQNTNTAPVTFTAGAKQLTVIDRLPFKTVAGIIPAASPVVFASTTSVYTYNPATGLNTAVIPTTQPVATPPYLPNNPTWTFGGLTIPAASNGIAGKLVIVFTASTSATAAVDGQYLNTVVHSFVDPTVNSALTETESYSGATLTINTLTVTKAASVSFVAQSTTGASTSYQIRIQNPGAIAQTLAVVENLPFGFLYNPVLLQASTSTATAFFVNRTTQASGAVSVANIRNATGVGALAAANAQFYIASTAAALFVIPANTDLYINLNNIYIQPNVIQGTYYNSLTTKTAAGLVLSTLNNTAPVTVGAPQLFINKTTTTPLISKNTVNLGTATVHYDITLTNMGNASATGVVLTDLLPRLTPVASPAATAYPVVIPANTVISITNNGVTTTLPAASYSTTQPAASNAITFTSLAPAGGFTIPGAVSGNNGILTVGFDVTLPAGADIGMYYNTVNASTTNAGTLSYASGSPFSITAFGIVKSVVAINGNVFNTTSVNSSDIVEYQIIATNTGPNNMPNLNITDILPAGFTYILNSASVTNTPVPPTAPLSPPTNPVGTSTLVWSPISTASNTAVIINFYAQAPATLAIGTYYNVASVNDGGTTTVSTGNTAPLTKSATPSLSMVKSTTATYLSKVDIASSANRTVHYEIIVTNTGSGQGIGVVLTDLLPRINNPASPTAYYPTIDTASVTVTTTSNAIPTVLAAASISTTQPASSTIVFTTNPAGGFTVPAKSGVNNGLLTIGFDVLIPAQADTGSYYNTVTASTSNAGTLTAASTAPFAISDILITKVVTQINASTTNTTTIYPGYTVRYKVTISNVNGPALPSASIADTLPGIMTYINNSASVGATQVNPAISGQTLTWPSVSLPSASGTITTTDITFDVTSASPAAVGVYYNNVAFTDGLGHTVYTGNTAPVTRPSDPVMALAKTAENINRTLPNTGLIAMPGETIRYTITTTASVATSYNVYIIDDIDPNISYVEGSEILNLTNSPALSFKNIEYYDRFGGTTPLASTSTIPAASAANSAIGRVIFRFNGTMTPPHWFTILLDAIVR